MADVVSSESQQGSEVVDTSAQDQAKAVEVFEGIRHRYLVDPKSLSLEEAQLYAKVHKENGVPIPAALETLHGEKLHELAPSQPGVPQGSAEPQAAAEVVVDVGTLGDDDEVAVSVKIPKKLFGTYIKNRTPDQALVEALKGNVEKDSYISTLRTKSLSLSDENQSLRSQLLAAQHRPAQPALSPSAPQEIDVSAMDISGVDFFNPNDQEKVKKSFSTLLSHVANLQKKPVEAPKPVIDEVEIKKQEAAAEYAEIAQLQLQDPSLTTSVPFADLDREMNQFYAGIARMTGGDLNTAWQRYNDPVNGPAFRAQCSTQGLILPPEHEIHSALMQVRTEVERSRAVEAEGLTAVLRAQGKLSANEVYNPKLVPRTGERTYAAQWQRVKAAQAAVAPQPQQTPIPAAPATPAINPALQAQIDLRREQQAPATAPTIPPGTGSAPVGDVMQISQDEFNRLRGKFLKDSNSLTTDEAQMYAQIHEKLGVPIPLGLKLKR